MAQEIDALTLLKKDHELVKDLMERVEKEKDTEQRISMFEQLIDELTIHERIEEEIFYPALQKLPNAKEDVLESFEEHHLVDQIVTGLDNTPASADTWPAKFTDTGRLGPPKPSYIIKASPPVNACWRATAVSVPPLPSIVTE